MQGAGGGENNCNAAGVATWGWSVELSAVKPLPGVLVEGAVELRGVWEAVPACIVDAIQAISA